MQVLNTISTNSFLLASCANTSKQDAIWNDGDGEPEYDVYAWVFQFVGKMSITRYKAGVWEEEVRQVLGRGAE